VDFILPASCYEVKYSDRVGREDVSHLKDVSLSRRLVITRSQGERLDGIELVPLWRFLMEARTVPG